MIENCKFVCRVQVALEAQRAAFEAINNLKKLQKVRPLLDAEASQLKELNVSSPQLRKASKMEMPCGICTFGPIS